MSPSPPGSRTQRRVARTKAAIEDAFVQLVLEHGYEQVAVEDISGRADLARATFYAHYSNKEAVLFSVFNRLIEDLMQRIAYQSGPWNEVRRDAIQAAYKHAAEMPDLYRACLSDARTQQSRVPIPLMARAFVGAHVAVLEAWLAGELTGDVEQLASMTLDLLIAGAAWANGFGLDELGYSTASPTQARKPVQAAKARPRGPQPASTPRSGETAGEPR